MHESNRFKQCGKLPKSYLNADLRSAADAAHTNLWNKSRGYIWTFSPSILTEFFLCKSNSLLTSFKWEMLLESLYFWWVNIDWSWTWTPSAILHRVPKGFLAFRNWTTAVVSFQSWLCLAFDMYLFYLPDFCITRLAPRPEALNHAFPPAYGFTCFCSYTKYLLSKIWISWPRYAFGTPRGSQRGPQNP